jgi:Mitosis protein DIM1
MSYLLPHLHSGWAVDQAILAEEERLVIIRFGHDWDETCMQVLLTFLLPDPFVIIVNLFILAYGVRSNLGKLRIWFH